MRGLRAAGSQVTARTETGLPVRGLDPGGLGDGVPREVFITVPGWCPGGPKPCLPLLGVLMAREREHEARAPTWRSRRNALPSRGARPPSRSVSRG